MKIIPKIIPKLGPKVYDKYSFNLSDTFPRTGLIFYVKAPGLVDTIGLSIAELYPLVDPALRQIISADGGTTKRDDADIILGLVNSGLLNRSTAVGSALKGYAIYNYMSSASVIDLAYRYFREQIPRNGIWERQGIVINADTAADHDNVQEPCVLYDTAPVILTGNEYVWKMWYSGGWATPYLNYAESLDGLTWTKYASNPLITGNARASVIKHNGIYYHYLNGKLYTSADGISLSEQVGDGLYGGQGWDDGGVVNTYVFIHDGVWYMFYESVSLTPGDLYKIGVATSVDGRSWTKHPSNPVLSLESGGISSPCVKQVGGFWYMWVHQSPSSTTPTDIYRYKSSDLYNWAIDTIESALYRSTTDEGIYRETGGGQIADADIHEVNGLTYLFYDAYYDQSGTTGKIKLATTERTLAEITRVNSEGGANVFAGSTGTRKLKLSLAPGSAFADPDYPHLFTDYVGHTLTIKDNTNKSLVGIIRSIGYANSFESISVPNGGFDNTDNWYVDTNVATIASIAGGVTGNCLEITRVSEGSQRTTTNPYIPVPSGALISASIAVKAGTSGDDSGGIIASSDNSIYMTDNIGDVVSNWTTKTIFATMPYGANGVRLAAIKNSATPGTMLFDDMVLRQVLTPGPHGVMICSDTSGDTLNWASEESGFDRTQETYTYTISDNPVSADWVFFD